MGQAAILQLDWRAAIALAGPDAVPFLQGLVSNDVARVTADRAIWSAFLTPQGKFLHEFMIVRFGDRLLLDCERERRGDLVRRLKMYKLRSQVTIEEADEEVVALFGPGIDLAVGFALGPGEARAIEGGVVYGDPRLAAMGWRGLVTADGMNWLRGLTLADSTTEMWDRNRIALGVPDGSRDLPVEKAILLENGFDELNGLDWDKGCYMGQELTARTHYRGLIRKRLLPVRIDGPPPAPDAPILCDGKEVGVVHSTVGGDALARLRLDAVQGDAPLTVGAARVIPQIPDWVSLPSRPSSG